MLDQPWELDGSVALRASACSDTSRVPFKSPSMNRTVKATHNQGTGTSPRPSEIDNVKTRSRFS